MTKQLCVFGVVAALGACGGGKKASTTPDDTGGGVELGGEPAIPNTNDASGVVSAETMDEIQRRFQRKGTAVSRCLAFAVDNKELPKNSRGKVRLEVTIEPSGKAGAIKVLSQTIESKSLTDCVLERVREIEFPTVPKPYPTTYTYAFEAM